MSPRPSCEKTGGHLLHDDGRCALCLLQVDKPGDWRDWWSATWRRVAYAINFSQIGECPSCGCRIDSCDYCADECTPL